MTHSSNDEERTWLALRRFTQARIGLGRSGDSLPTNAVLDFGLAHAQARDAVHMKLDLQGLSGQLASAGFEWLNVRSAIGDRLQYLRRPDMGRRLSDDSRNELSARGSLPTSAQFVPVLADGLSALAVMRHAVPLLVALRTRLGPSRIAPVVVAEQARVALGDEIGAVLKAQLIVMLIGERPGLSSPDSLGAYLTYAPRVGLTDADRNCISNIRLQGLSYQEAALRLSFLIEEAGRRRITGVALKDESAAALSGTARIDKGGDQT